MIKIRAGQIEEIMAEAIDAIPGKYLKHLENVAFIMEDEPSMRKLKSMGLWPNRTLLGLYEGVPLPQRMGTTKLLPDKVTLYRKPLQASSENLEQLTENVRHTLWHEVAHYFGLDHKRINELEEKSRHNLDKRAI